MNECEKLLKTLVRSSGIVSGSLNSGDYVPEFRYKNFEKDIKAAREYLANQAKKCPDMIQGKIPEREVTGDNL